MSVVLNTNYTATVAANNLAASSSMLQKSLNRLSSGSKIVNPSDDAGGLAVSMKLSATSKRQGAVNSPQVFMSGARAEDAAISLGLRLADSGRPAEILVYLRDGALGGRYVYPARS